MANYNDRFTWEINHGRYLAAASLAIQFGEGKGSKSGAWSWADAAAKAAAQRGVELDPGPYSWPDFETMRDQLERGLA